MTTCLNCGKPIIGRSDKRYCDDACRAQATRKRNKLGYQTEIEEGHKAILNAIKRNYRLLKNAIAGREEWIVDFSVLYLEGFDQQFYTSSEVIADHTRYYCALSHRKNRLFINREI